jgi:hypothetical protein
MVLASNARRRNLELNLHENVDKTLIIGVRARAWQTRLDKTSCNLFQTEVTFYMQD